ncbi:MAG: SpoIIE family protein phosphatase [Thermodesulfobacteriota bacterium]
MENSVSRKDLTISPLRFARATRRAAMGANFTGVVFCVAYFLLFRLIHDLRTPSFSLTVSLGVYLALMSVGLLITKRRQRPVLAYAKALEAGENPGREAGAAAMARLLDLPFAQASVSLVNWVVAALLVPALTLGDTLFTVPPGLAAARYLRIFAGVLVAGAVAGALAFFYAENHVRRVLPLWFPDGRLEDAAAARRLRLRTRMGISLVLSGLLPVSLLAVLSVNRVRMFLSYDPGDVLSDLTKLAVFFLSSSALLTLAVARLYAKSVVGPISGLARAMDKVKVGDLSVRVDVCSNDELGSLSEDFNDMVEGLRDRERMRIISLELEKGRQIQQDFLPGVLPDAPGWELCAELTPAREVSGDFYDVFYVGEGLLAIAVGDVCDKGVGSALFMALIRSLLRVYSRRRGACDGDRAVLSTIPEGRDERTVSAAGLVNRYLAAEHGGLCMFATLFWGVLDLSDGSLFYVNAGHEPPVVLRGGRAVSVLASSGPAVGVISGIAYPWKKIVLESGDTLFCYTDGATEAQDPEGRAFSRQRLMETLETAPSGAHRMVEGVRRALAAYGRCAPCADDVTLLAVKREE